MSNPYDIKNSIINFCAAFDTEGQDSKKIDTYLEYKLLGSMLNGNLRPEHMEKISNLSEKQFKKFEKAFSKEYKKYEKEFNSLDSQKIHISKATKENINDYIAIWQQLYWQEKSENDRIAFEKLEKVLCDFAKENGANVDEFKQEGTNWGFVIKNLLKTQETTRRIQEKAEVSLETVYNPYNPEKLKNKVDEYIKLNNITELTEQENDVDLGNGKYDKPATQKTNLCWAHAGINSLLKTEKGKVLVENNRYYDPKTGVFGIHLQEAENNDLHDGIYIITPEDIKNEGPELSEGEGDVTAYMIAIKRYFAEVRANPELEQKMEKEKHSVRDVENGNSGYRFFEIMTGGTYAEYPELDHLPLQNGIGTGLSNAVDFDFLLNIIKNKNGAVVLSMNNHALSVISERDGKFLVQESNNDSNFPQDFRNNVNDRIMFKKVEDNNGMPTYELSRDDYYIIDAASYIKW